MALSPLLGSVDSDGIARLQPRRAGRRPAQSGRNGHSNPRWLGRITFGLLLNAWGGIVGWQCAPAHVPETGCPPRRHRFQNRRLSLADTGFQAPAGEPSHLTLCPRGTGHKRRLLDTILSMLTGLSHTKHLTHRVAEYLPARLAGSVPAFKRLVQGDGLRHPDADGFLLLTIAEFTL